MDLFVNFVLRNLPELQAEGHIVVNRHMRVQRVVLKDHRDIAVLRFDLVHFLVVDKQRTPAYFFESRDHTQRRRFTAAGRTDEDDKFLIRDIQVKILDRDKTVVILFCDIFQLYFRHFLLRSFYEFYLLLR